jgi:hypothetical protein
MSPTWFALVTDAICPRPFTYSKDLTYYILVLFFEAKNNVQEDADDGSQYLALEQNEQEDIGQVYIFYY